MWVQVSRSADAAAAASSPTLKRVIPGVKVMADPKPAPAAAPAPEPEPEPVKQVSKHVVVE